MAGINHLKEVFDKRGEEFLNNLLNNYVIINEKMDGTFFGVKKDKGSDKFRYFKKSGEISYVDRVLMKYYNAAIAHFERLPIEKRQRIPSNFYFGFEYLTNHDNLSSGYDRLPKNQLTLSYIHRLDDSGNPIETFQTKLDLDKWADFLDVERSPIIFEGMLNDDQKTAIMDFVYSPFEDLYNKFKTTSFTKYVITLLNPEQKSSYLKKDLSGNIEGIVFRFYNEKEENPEAKTFLAKLVDPIFQKRNKEHIEKRENKSNDYIWLIVIDLMNFIETYDSKDIKEYSGSESDSYDVRYVKVINSIFKDFIKEFSYKYEGIELQVPEYLNRAEFEIDSNLIGDPEVNSIIKSNETYKEIYRIFLNFFRRPRKKTSSSFFTKDLLEQLNLQINKIKSIIMGDEIYEGLFPSFNEFVGSSGESYLISEEDFSKKSPKPTKVNLLIGSFQPVNMGHIKAANKLHSANGFPVIFIAIKGKTNTPKAPFSTNVLKILLAKVQQEYSEIIESTKVISMGQIEDIISELRPQYEPILWGTSEKRLKDYVLQLDYIKKRDIQLSISSDFKLVELPVFQKADEVIESIAKSDFQEFKKLVPKSITSEFFNLQHELEKVGMKVAESIEPENQESINESKDSTDTTEEQVS